MGKTIILDQQEKVLDNKTANPIKVIHASAPTRVCDIGGWTDTWFARYGNIFSMAVYPGAEVQIKCFRTTDEPFIKVHLENFGDRYVLRPNHITYGRHPLIDAAIESVPLPEDMSFEINVFSSMPPGASTGTSGAISVAIIGGLDALTEGRLSAAETARTAHEVETVKLGRQGGIQDQLASAYGGINYIEMRQYPYATVSPIEIPEYVWWELEHRLLLVYIGAPHNSSRVHQKVIEKLGADASENPLFHALRQLAKEAKDAAYAGDLAGLGRIMNENTEIQRRLHKELVSEALEDVISISGNFGALGCKVNGAGGDGGTVTVLTDRDMAGKRMLIKALKEKGYQVIPISLARHGLRVW
jgi:D-glycero-alpha-D-manno-heptose-7-phosphate kinase